MSNHVVHKVSMVLPANDYTEAGQHQATAKQWVQQSLNNMLTSYLDELEENDELVYIDKIEINIPNLPWKLTDAAWQQTFEATIRLDNAAANTVDIIVAQWCFYLQHGCFQKTAIFHTRQAIEQYFLLHPDALSAALLQRYADLFSLSFLQRLFYQHSKELAAQVITHLFGLKAGEQVDVVYTAVLRQLKEEPHQTYALLAKIINAARQGAVAEKAAMLALLSGKAQQTDKTHFKESLPSVANGLTIQEQQPAVDVFINCPNAGLVLLFPFIQRFFENCELLEGNSFISEVARQTAIQALHYLATGESFGVEEELVLPRLLCGMPLGEYIMFEQELSVSVQTEADELLIDVVGHWQVLKNTSADGFRTTFLKRLGRLLQKGETCTLQVEESGVDILLNSIPWGFRNYRLPWMPLNIITEWY